MIEILYLEYGNTVSLRWTFGYNSGKVIMTPNPLGNKIVEVAMTSVHWMVQFSFLWVHGGMLLPRAPGGRLANYDQVWAISCEHN